jgi:hypothetical protein
MNRLWICGVGQLALLVGAGVLDCASANAQDPAAVRHFESQIAPLLSRRCLECHGATSKKGRLDLSLKEAAFTGGENGKAVVPGKADDSLLWQYVESDEMPKSRTPLSAQEKALLKKWIDDGAAWPAETIIGSSAGRPAENWLRRLTVHEYIETVRVAVGVDIERDALRLLPPDMRADGFSNTAYNLHVDLAHVEAYARLAQLIAARIDPAAFAGQYWQRRALNDAAMRELIAGMGKWLLRGPMEEHEIEAYLSISRAVAKEKGTYPEAVRFLVEAMLQSPRFVYRVERQRESDRRLSDYELASRLSYTLWGGPPDRELMRAADAGELSDRGQVETHVKRMLQDPRAVRRSQRFIHDWMDLDRLAHLRPNPSHFPKWNDALAGDMRDETLAFFEEVAWNQKRPLAELLNAPVTFATPRLAAHYGIPQTTAVAGGVVPQTEPATQTESRATSGLLALYAFDEGGGNTVRDQSGAGEPIHLKIENTSAVRWSDRGLVVNSGALIASQSPPQRMTEAIKKSKALTLEAWITPANATQAGPARIVTLSADSNGRNFTLGQDGDKFEVRLRTAKTDGNGMPALVGQSGMANTRQTHLVYTRDSAGKARLYINGEQKGAHDAGGELANWDGRFRLALANELTKDRPWQGTLHLVAIYDRALSAEEAKQNHAAGARPAAAAALASFAPASQRVSSRLEALYTFDEASGDTVRDSAAAGEPLHLKIENAAAVKWETAGLAVNGSTLIAAAQPPKRLIDAVKKSKAVTLEAWVTPADTQQSGPARILTLSNGVVQRNFTLGQDGNKYDIRFRGSATDGSGLPSLSSPSGAVQKRPTHVVYSRDAAGKAKLYINGEEKGARDVPGNLANWDDGFRLALANETSKDRPWRGTYHLVAIYSRALSAEEVKQNQAAGARQDGSATLASAPSVSGPAKDVQAQYAFDEGRGNTLRDTSGAGAPLDLKIENTAAVDWQSDGLKVSLPTLIDSGSPPKRLIDAAKKANAITLEAWITPADVQQSGPARILTLSSGTGARNFTLGQEGDKIDVRFRTTKSDGQGQPSLTTKSGAVATKRTHVVFARERGGKARLYIDGKEQASRDMPGDLSNWDGGYRLALANETTKDRPWRGTLHYVAIYNRALAADEVQSRAEAPAAAGGLVRYDLSQVPGRGGLLTHGSVLTVGGDEASMVTRGLFMLNELLYDRVEDPPPCVDTTPVPTKPGQTQRTLAEARIKNLACGGCHGKFEPLAFGLERLDGLGTYRDVDEHGNPLREDGEIVFPGQDQPVAYKTAGELMDLLAANARVQMAITRKVAQFALGRPLVESDLPLIDEIHNTAQKNGGTYAAVITAVVMSDLVQKLEGQ